MSLRKEIKFRTVELVDAKLIYEWRNDSLTRKMSLNSEKIDYVNHLHWFNSALNNNKVNIYICIIGLEEVGSIRVNTINNINKLNWMVSPNHRGKNYGFIMLNEFLIEHKGKYIAEIKEENIASINLATKAGMKVYKKENAILSLGI